MVKTNIKNLFLSKIIVLISLLALITLSIAGPLSAQTLNQGYKSDQPLQTGMMVKEKDGDNSKVEPVSQNTLKDLKGVVVSKNDSPVVIATEDQTIFVSNSGVHDVLVSDENGPIKSGDYLSVSSIVGIAMKVSADETLVLGRASADFNGNGDTIGTTTRQSDNKRINFGRIQVDIAIAANPTQKKSPQEIIPKILQNISASIVGKPVSNARIWLASIIFLVTSMVTGIMLYGAARSSLIAIGRNPLSKTSIIRGLLQVVILGLIVFICGMFGVYLLLKL